MELHIFKLEGGDVSEAVVFKEWNEVRFTINEAMKGGGFWKERDSCGIWSLFLSL